MDVAPMPSPDQPTNVGWAHPGDEVLSEALARKERRLAAGKNPNYGLYGYVCLDCRHPSSGHGFDESSDGYVCEVCGCVLHGTDTNREVPLTRREWARWEAARA